MTDRERSLVAAWWERRTVGGRVALSVIGALFGLVLAVNVLNTLTGGSQPGGPTSSSYATGEDGLAAYADLRGRQGHEVSRLRHRLDQSALSPADTLIIADPDQLSAGERDAVERFVRNGGRLVAGGPAVAPLLRQLVGPSLSWAPRAPTDAHLLAPAPEVAGVRKVATGQGGWRNAGRALPVFGDENVSAIAVTDEGAGRVVLLASSAPLQNGGLARSDDAQLAVAAAGAASRPVRFAEAAHGFQQASGGGLSALPSAWKDLLLIGVAATAALMWARGRRLGPVEVAERPLSPARRRYVDAMAATLAKTSADPAAFAPVVVEARRRLARRAGLGPEPSALELHRAGKAAGLTEEEAAAVAGGVHDDASALSAGRALTRLGGGSW